MKITIIIPAYNEAKSISRLVKTIKDLGYDVVVVDDGSIDSTADLARKQGALVISTNKKTGKGNALRLGFAQAIGQGYDAVITMDGDGQHSPGDIAHFLQYYDQTKADIICGNRMESPLGMPWIRQITNGFMSWMISKICRQKILDTQCGFRFIKTDVLKTIELQSNDFEIETEILIKASQRGFHIAGVPIQTIYRDEVSKIRPVRDTIRFVCYMSKEILKR